MKNKLFYVIGITMLVLVILYFPRKYEVAGFRYFKDGQRCEFSNNVTLEEIDTIKSSCTKCYHISKECTCFGSVGAGESNPPTYFCNGIKYCKDVDKSVC